MLLNKLYEKNSTHLQDKYLLKNSMKKINQDRICNRSSIPKAIHSIAMFETISQVESMAFVAKKKHGLKFLIL